MRTQQIGTTPLVSTRLSYGCMRVAGTWDYSKVTPEKIAAGEEACIAAYEAGYTLFDHADIYGSTACEEIFSGVLKKVGGMRERILIATKCGIRHDPHRFDFSAEHILRSCDLSLKRLGVETIDIYQLHRPDILMDPLEVAEAFAKLHSAGKVRYFGVSNFLPSFVSLLQSACPFPLAVNQVEIHLGRLDCFYDGTLDQCLASRMTPLSWSPLGGGFLGTGGEVRKDHARREGLEKLTALLDEIAREHGSTRTVVSLAWLLKHPSGIIPIVGTVNPERIREAAKADELELSREEWYRILVAARMEPLP
ncbi:MAG TPA: aldo/keto reductase [Fimbriimonadaceae bacterium]|nr:aldo/keto reductase [Fimbriimonadaceae bacterium]